MLTRHACGTCIWHHSFLSRLLALLITIIVAAEEEEEVQRGEDQLAVRPADMSFEQAMRHYMDDIARTARDTNSQLQTLNNRYVVLSLPWCPWLICDRHAFALM